MVDQNLLDYVKNQRKNGVEDETIKKNLLANHWSEKHVHEALYGVVPDPKRDQLLSFSQLLSATWNLFRQKLLQLLFISALPTLILVGAGIFFGVIFVPISALIGSSLFSSTSLIFYLIIAIVAIILSLGFFYFTLWCQTALIMCVSQEDISIKDSFKRARSYIWRFYWVAFLTGLITIGYFIFGIIAVIWFSQVNFVVVNEDEKGISALLKSREYIRGRWYPVFGRYLVFGIGYILLLLIVQAITRLLGSTALETVIGLIVQFTTTPFFICFAYVLYDDLKKVRGKFDFQPTRKTKILYTFPGLLSIPLVVIFMILMVMFAISPITQIQKAQAARRNSNLLMIRTAAEMYYTNNGKLPTSLETLIPIELTTVPKDPVSGVTYQIIITDPKNFDVCAIDQQGQKLVCDNELSPAVPLSPSDLYNKGNGQR